MPGFFALFRPLVRSVLNLTNQSAGTIGSKSVLQSTCSTHTAGSHQIAESVLCLFRYRRRLCQTGQGITARIQRDLQPESLVFALPAPISLVFSPLVTVG